MNENRASEKPRPSMVCDSPMARLRGHMALTNEAMIESICEMNREEEPDVMALRKMIRRLDLARALLRCPENQGD